MIGHAPPADVEKVRCWNCSAPQPDDFDRGLDLKVAASLLPVTVETLKTFLSRHKAEYPSRFRLAGCPKVRLRVLYVSELKRIRATMQMTAMFRRKVNRVG